jgi:hypothetical protein
MLFTNSYCIPQYIYHGNFQTINHEIELKSINHRSFKGIRLFDTSLTIQYYSSTFTKGKLRNT